MKLSKKDYLFGRTCQVLAETGPGSVSAAYEWIDPINTAMNTSGFSPSCFIASLVIEHFLVIPEDDGDIDIPDDFWARTDVRGLYWSCHAAWFHGRSGDTRPACQPQQDAYDRGVAFTAALKE